MKIAYFIDTVVPSKRANTVHVMKMCQAFQTLGCDTTLYCDMDAQNTPTDSILERYAVTTPFSIERVQIGHFLQKHGHRFALMVSAYKKSKQAKDFDVAYSRSAYALFFLKDRHKYILEVHTEPDRLNYQIEKMVISHENCIALVAISQALKQRYLELFPFLKPEKIVVLHDCADDNSHLSTEKAVLENLPGSHPVRIGYIGHLYPGKCMEVLTQVAVKTPSFTYHIVGGTDEWVQKWKAYCMEHGIRNFIFYGFVDNAKVGKYYRAFDIFVLPFSKRVSVGTTKNMDIGQWISPLKLFEGMAYQKAMVVSALPTIQEVLTNGQNAVLVEPDDIDGWVNALTELAENPALRSTLGSEAYRLFKEAYTWEKRAQAIIKILEDNHYA